MSSPYGVLGQVWYWVLSIPDIRLSTLNDFIYAKSHANLSQGFFHMRYLDQSVQLHALPTI